MMLKFAAAAIFAIVVVSLASLIWPKFSSKPRPKGLQQVRDVVVKTQVGQEVANVMGVATTTEGGVPQPISLNAVAASIGSTIVNGVSKKASEIVSNQTAAILVAQIKQLPTPAQEEIRQGICKP